MREITKILFNKFVDENGSLCVYQELEKVPFNIQRVFTIVAKKGQLRGNHAHKTCSQILICVHGCIKVSVDYGFGLKEYYTLSGLENGLLIPPYVWSGQEYLIDDSVLMVVCSSEFDEDDYIRDYQEFLRFLK